jgi:transcription-repair coupling factor (superfamily II helicase)
MVAQNVKKGAQFTPQGVLRFPLKATEPLDVLDEIKTLLEELAAREDVEVAAPHQRR